MLNHMAEMVNTFLGEGYFSVLFLLAKSGNSSISFRLLCTINLRLWHNVHTIVTSLVVVFFMLAIAKRIMMCTNRDSIQVVNSSIFFIQLQE
jgi:hypothetical protein